MMMRRVMMILAASVVTIGAALVVSGTYAKFYMNFDYAHYVYAALTLSLVVLYTLASAITTITAPRRRRSNTT